jgi:hypothetical protein
MYCCAESNDCQHEARCGVALLALQQCRHDARLADNSRIALAQCNANFAQNGGSLAQTALTCMMSNCQSTCTEG